MLMHLFKFSELPLALPYSAISLQTGLAAIDEAHRFAMGPSYREPNEKQAC